MVSKPARNLLTIIMNLLIVVAVILTASIIVGFFGALSSQAWGEALIDIGKLVTIPFGFDPIKTPYGGTFLVDPALTIGVLLLAEWLLSVARQHS